MAVAKVTAVWLRDANGTQGVYCLTKSEYYASHDEQGTLFNEWSSPVSQCGFDLGCRTADEAVNGLEPGRKSTAMLSSEVVEAWQKRSLCNHASPHLTLCSVFIVLGKSQATVI